MELIMGCSFPISCILLLTVIFKDEFLRLKPLAREKVFENAKEGIIILDAKYNIADFNSSAAKVVKALKSNILGKRMYSVLENHRDLIEAIISDDKMQFEVLKNDKNAIL